VDRLSLERGYFRRPSGAAVYLIGANFWPKKSGPWMYREPWDADGIQRDLSELAQLGANVVRTFCFLPDFLPSPDAIDTTALQRLEMLVELAAQQELWSVPTFLVGHMSGENWAPDWSLGRDWYTDAGLLRASELLVQAVVTRFSGDARIAAYLVTNEWPLFAGVATPANGFAWAERMCAAVRGADPHALVSLGDGSWDMMAGEQTGLPTPALKETIDFVGPHFYPKETDSLRHSGFAAFAMRMLQPFGLPVLLEEFGCSSDQTTDENAAHYYRTVLWSAFGAGNCGSLFWNSHDFACEDKPPYDHHPYELHFGVLRTDGSPKPQAEEVRRFARVMRGHDPDEWQPQAAEALIGRCSYYTTAFPFDWGWTKKQLNNLYLQAYVTASLAGLNAAFVDLTSLEACPATKLLLLPCLQQITTEDVAQLYRFADGGGTVYLSCGGEPWFPGLADFIGAKPNIRYGLVEPPAGVPINLRLTSEGAAFTRAAAGERELGFSVRGAERLAAPLRCSPLDATVLALDNRDDPALLLRPLGKGRVVFLTYPLEYYALNGLEGNADNPLWKVYAMVAKIGGVRPPISTGVPDVQCFVRRAVRKPPRQRILLVNHAWRDVQANLTDGEGRPVRGLSDVESGEQAASANVRLGPKAVRIFERTL